MEDASLISLVSSSNSIFFNLEKQIYTNAMIHDKGEFRAFYDMVDHGEVFPGEKAVFIGNS